MRGLEAELRRLFVHAADEAFRTLRRDARQGAGGGVVGRNQQQVQQVVGRHLVVRVQMGRRRLKDVAARDGHRLRQIRVVLEEHRRGHHLGDAGDRALRLRVLFPEDLVGVGVVDDRGGGAKIRDQPAARVDLVARQDGLGHLARGRDGAGAGELDLARLRPLRRIHRRARPRLPLRAVVRSGLGRRLQMAASTNADKRQRAQAGPRRKGFFCSLRTVPETKGW